MTEPRAPSLVDALIPVVFLISLLSLSVYFFGDSSSSGPNQIALILSACVALLVGWKNGHRWPETQEAFSKGISIAINALFILLAVGTLIGSWIISGTVPAMIYYGLKLINPTIFYFTACLICALTSLAIGSSWSTAGTVGIGLMGVAAGLGLPMEITAGAIISGAYFGDKMSPLSDTTNLAPAVAGTELFTHIRHMMWTSGPAIILALIGYLIIGAMATPTGAAAGLEDKLTLLDETFHVGVHLLIPLAILIFMAWRQYPAFPTIIVGGLVGAIFALLFQMDNLLIFAGESGLDKTPAALAAIWAVMSDGYKATTADPALNDLLSRGGMASMLNTVWLIMSAMFFGAIVEHMGLLKRLVDVALSFAKTTGSLILSTALTSLGVNILAADQYIAIVIPGRMYRAEFKRKQLAPKNLSRVIEDTGTVTSVLIPWNTCGAYMSGVLGVATFAYLPFCFFNLLSPVISVLYGYRNFTIEPLTADKAPA